MKYLLILVAFIAFFSCKKTTMVHGKVTEVGTGNPVKGVNLVLVASRWSKKTPDKITVDMEEFTTGDDGLFAMEVESKKGDNIGFYGGPNELFFDSIEGIGLTPGENKEINYELTSKDAGILQITFKNESSEQKEVTYCLDNNSMFSPNSCFDCTVGLNSNCYFPLKINPGQTRVIPLVVNAPGNVTLVWDTQPLTGAPWPNPQTVYCGRTDTAFIEVKL